MTLFEYLAVAFSIVLGFSVTHLLASVPSVFRAPRRYSNHAAFFVLILLMHPQLWWALWDLHNDAPWNLLTFFYTLVGPSLLYLTATSLVPVDRSFSDPWETHFNASRHWIFGFLAAYALWGIGEVYWLFQVSLFHPYRIVQGSLFVLALAGALSRKPRHDRFIVAMLIIVFIGGQLIFRVNPGGYLAG